MASSSLPSTFLSPSPKTSPPSSLFFLKYHPQIHSLTSFRPQKLKILCCQQTVEPDIGRERKINSIKKKRKPRPSFLDQVQNKWSVKTPSLRQNFPWQDHEISDRNQETQAQSLLSSSDRESGKICSAIEPPLSYHTKTKSTLAPWIHGNELRKQVCNFEGSRKSEKPSVSVIHNIVKEVRPEREGEENFGGEFVETPTGPPKKNKILDLSTTFTNMEYCSSEANDSKRSQWERRTDREFVMKDGTLRNRNTELAERLIPEHELKRLRNVSLRMGERMKVGAAGVTQALVRAVHERWKHDEVVKLKFEGPPSMNMKRTHKFLENRRFSIWRSGGLIVLYRGMAYKLGCVQSYSKRVEADSGALRSSPEDFRRSIKIEHLNVSRVYMSNFLNDLSKQEQVDLHEVNRLLDELGPRCVDWLGREPLPVDADLLPAVVPGYKTPFRLLPHGVRQALRNKETTYLRRTARIIPPHFALGRNRELQGLGRAMVKLWEKSVIAKIAIKRGVQNIFNGRMAEELKLWNK